MERFSMHVDPQLTVGQVTGNMFGLFFEGANGHFSGGIYQPDADKAAAFMPEVIQWLRDMRPGYIRFPGGNNLATWNWKNTIGPRSERRANVMPAHCGEGIIDIERNDMGLDEFAGLIRLIQADGMMTVNLCTDSLRDRLDLLEYCHVSSGTYWSDLRRSNGAQDPYDFIRYWYLGNETDGDWIIGQHSAETYSREARETAKMVKTLFPGIQTVLAGSSNPSMKTWPEWDIQVLDRAFDYIDLLSIHHIHICNPPDSVVQEHDFSTWKNLPRLLDNLDRFIETAGAAIQLVQAKHRSWKKIPVCIDEWDIAGLDDTVPLDHSWQKGRVFLSRESQKRMEEAGIPPQFRRAISLLTTVAFCGTLVSFINHADIVSHASKCLFFDGLIAVAGGHAIRSVAYDAYRLFSKEMRGTSVRYTLMTAGNGTRTAAVYHSDTDELRIAAVNLSTEESSLLEVTVAGTDWNIYRAALLSDPEPLCANTFENPDRIHIRSIIPLEKDNQIMLPPVSFALLYLKKGE